MVHSNCHLCPQAIVWEEKRRLQRNLLSAINALIEPSSLHHLACPRSLTDAEKQTSAASCHWNTRRTCVKISQNPRSMVLLPREEDKFKLPQKPAQKFPQISDLIRLYWKNKLITHLYDSMELSLENSPLASCDAQLWPEASAGLPQVSAVFRV